MSALILWSLGAVLYEMMTGRVPFLGDTPSETVSLILQKQPAPLTRYTHEVPAELERIVTKAFTKICRERYQSAKDVLIDLRNLKRKREVEAEIDRTVAPELEVNHQHDQTVRARINWRLSLERYRNRDGQSHAFSFQR